MSEPSDPKPLFFIGRGSHDTHTVSVQTGCGYRSQQAAEEALARVVELNDPTYCIVQMGEIVRDFRKPRPKPIED